jgi:opacity protein-like surface antigen
MRKFLLLMVLVFCGTFAFAQKAELAGGWDYLHVDCNGCDQAGVPGGFFVDGTYYFAKVIGLTGDFQYHKKTFAPGETGRFLSFHGGPRFKARMGKIEPFAHALFGITNLNQEDVTGTFCFGATSCSDNAFSMKLGGGLDIGVAPHFALRLGEFNYYMTKFSVASGFSTNGNDHQNNFTFGVGVVLR